jgi:hypothetical protein
VYNTKLKLFIIENRLFIHSKYVVTENLDLTIYQQVENVTKIGVSTNTGFLELDLLVYAIFNIK